MPLFNLMWSDLSTLVQIINAPIQECNWICPSMSKTQSPLFTNVTKYVRLCLNNDLHHLRTQLNLSTLVQEGPLSKKIITLILKCDQILVILMSDHLCPRNHHPYPGVQLNLSTLVEVVINLVHRVRLSFGHPHERPCLSKSFSKKVSTKFWSFFGQVMTKIWSC